MGKGEISIFLLNICSFNKNINLFTEYLNCIKHKFNIILLTAWLTSHDNPSIYFPTYHLFQLNCLYKKKKRGHGVLALVDTSLEASIVEVLTE